MSEPADRPASSSADDGASSADDVGSEIGRVYGFLRWLVLDDGLALDLTRRALVAAHGAITTREPCAQHVLLYRQATVAGLAALRRDHLSLLLRRVTACHARDSTIASELTGSTDDQRRIELALGDLSAADRACLLLKFRFALSYAELSEVFGIALGEARLRVGRARAQLRETIIRLDPGEPARLPTSCARARARLTLVVDEDPGDDLDAHEVAEIERHLETCAACSRCLALDRHLARTLQQLAAAVLTPAQTRALLQQIETELDRARRTGPLRRSLDRPANAFAAAIGLILVGFVVVLAVTLALPLARRNAESIGRPPAAAMRSRVTLASPVPATRAPDAKPITPTAKTVFPPHVTGVVATPVSPSAQLGAHPEAVTFVDADHGWVLDGDCDWPGPSGCSVLATADGGSTWTEQFHTTLAVPEIFFLDRDHGWLLESNCPGADGACPTAILRTTDGGWSSSPAGARLGSVTPGGAQVLEGLSRSWVQVGATREDLSGVQFLNPLEGWALGRACPPHRNDCTMEILRTVDGGTTWTDTTPKQVTPKDVSFVDPVHGWAFGCSVRDRLPNDYCLNPLVLATDDGGNHWAVQLQLNGGVREYDGRLDFVDRTEGWLLLSLGNGSSCAAADCWGPLYHTSAAGVTWKQVQEWPSWNIRDLRNPDTLISAWGKPSDLRFVTSKLGWITFGGELDGSHGRLAITSNGGQTWFLVGADSGWDVKRVQVTASTSGTVIWAVGTRRTVSGQISFLAKSTDLGASWQQVLPTTSPINAVDFPDSR